MCIMVCQILTGPIWYQFQISHVRITLVVQQMSTCSDVTGYSLVEFCRCVCCKVDT